MSLGCVHLHEKEDKHIAGPCVRLLYQQKSETNLTVGKTFNRGFK
jgi:hypothetical protein